MPTGQRTVDVLDVDVKPTGNGWRAFNMLKRAGLLAGACALVKTRSCGLHAYYRPLGQPCGSLRGKYLDLKADLGYVLVPPSRVEPGAYSLLEWRPTATGTLDWTAVRRLLDPPRPPVYRRFSQRAESIGQLAEWLSRQPCTEGNRNHATFWAACQALDDGAADLEPIVGAALALGLSEREVQRTVESAYRHVAGVS
jgi:hypothetical protein